jgi:hypothetical protein
MKLKFRTSKVYNKRLYPDLTEENFELIQLNAKNFLKRYSKEIEKIVRLLPKVTGRKWPEIEGKEIEVYFVYWNITPFSHPLTLNVKKELLNMLVCLTHELGHHLFKYSCVSKGEHKLINDWTEEIFKKLKIDTGDRIEKLREISER